MRCAPCIEYYNENVLHIFTTITILLYNMRIIYTHTYGRRRPVSVEQTRQGNLLRRSSLYNRLQIWTEGILYV